MSADPAVTRPSPERQWWLRTLAIFQSPRPVFRALRDDSDEEAAARSEPVLAIVFLAGIAGVLSARETGRLLDYWEVDAVLVEVVVLAQLLQRHPHVRERRIGLQRGELLHCQRPGGGEQRGFKQLSERRHGR